MLNESRTSGEGAEILVHEKRISLSEAEMIRDEKEQTVKNASI